MVLLKSGSFWNSQRLPLDDGLAMHKSRCHGTGVAGELEHLVTTHRQIVFFDRDAGGFWDAKTGRPVPSPLVLREGTQGPPSPRLPSVLCQARVYGR